MKKNNSERITDVILINPPLYYEGGAPIILDVSYPPLGILYLAAVLEKNDIRVKVIDVGAEKQSLTQTISLITKESPAVVGISSMTPTLQGAVTLAKVIKKRFKKITVSLGGSHVSADPEFIKRIRLFDFAVTGESETVFLTKVKEIFNNKKVKGVFPGRPVKDLNLIPWPARHLINLNLYNKRASLIATRGCPYACYYCSRPGISNLVRCRQPKDVVDEMELLNKTCGGDFLFQDDAMTINKKFVLDLCQQLIERKKNFRWACYTRVDLVDGEIIKKMAEAGCYSIDFGIESGNERVRNEIINKKFSNSQIKKTLALCNQNKINADGFFMFGHPTETKEEVKETMRFILENNFNLIGVSIATPFPGSKLWEYAVRDKIINDKFVDDFALGRKGKGYAGVWPVYLPKDQDLNWLYEQRRRIMRKFYLRPKRIFKAIKEDLQSWDRIKRDFTEGFNVLMRGSSARAPYRKSSGDKSSKFKR